MAKTGTEAGRRAGWLVATTLGVAAGGLASVGFVRFVHGIDRAERDPPVAADAIVALTGGAQRIGDAVDLLARGFGQRLLITGVNERTTRDEIARLNPGERRLLDCCVDLDYRAQNTVGNAAETGRWSRQNGFRSLIVVTSNYHMPRTLAEFDHAMPGVKVLPHPVVTGAVDAGSPWGKLSTTRLLVSEYAKYVGCLIRTALTASWRASWRMAALDADVRLAAHRSESGAR